MKAFDLPLYHNPLATRADLVASLHQLLEPLKTRFTPGDAGLHLGNTEAHYDPKTTLFEGYSRLFWGLGPLAAGGDTSPLIDAMVRGLDHGTDPAHPAYWGVGGNSDQRQVEMAALAQSLLLAPQVYWDPLGPEAQERLAAWLNTINQVSLPPTNWEFFRVFVNIALRRLGKPYDQARLSASLGFIDALYRDDGWYIDETNYDYYNPFAFHYYGLVYAQLMESEDPVRCAEYRRRARLFARQFTPWFGSSGTLVAHGRSLAYRFAPVAFYGACAFAGEEVLPWGELKGMVLRHLRWWFSQPIVDHEGVLTIGYAYPNLVLAEQYNSPGSPYWALKAYLPLALAEDHPFWASEEAPLAPLPSQTRLDIPRLLIARSGGAEDEHVWMLAAGQYPIWESVQSAAKYAKFAYSDRFGFCVSHSSFDLTKTGCDSSLVFSEGDGYWRERRHSTLRRAQGAGVGSRWLPWSDVVVDTWLVALGGPWHARVHRVVTPRRLEAVEGGFSLPDHNGFDAVPPPVVQRGPGSLTLSQSWAWGTVADLTADRGAREAAVHKPEPNLNILHPRVLVPVLTTVLEPGTHVLACVVGAGLGQPEAPPAVRLVLEGPGAPYLDADQRHPIVWG